MNSGQIPHEAVYALVLYVAAYLFGAIPFGVLIARARGIDILNFGSGNIGATNVMRATGAPLGILVFFLDVAKGAVPALLGRVFLPLPLWGIDAQVLWVGAGLMAVIGHCLSPFLGFKGGKGVSTALGMVVGAAPLVAVTAFAFFIVLLSTTRYMALSSSIAVSSGVLLTILLPGQSPQIIPIYLAIGAFVSYRHRSNFARMRAGTEPKFSFKKTATTHYISDSQDVENEKPGMPTRNIG